MDEAKEQEDLGEEPLASYLIAAPMKNDIGEHNSFINVIIHSLHYIPEISKYITETDISDEEQYNMVIELQRLLDKYDKLTSIIYCPKISKNLRNLNILQLRRELEYLFSKEKLFKVQATGDPVDAYYFILNGIHSYCNNKPNLKEVDNKDCTGECVVHSALMIYLVEQLECPRCLKKSDLQKFPSNTFFYELKVEGIFKKTESMNYFSNFKGMLFQFSREELTETEEECPQPECKDTRPLLKRNVILVKSNKYISFALTWPDPNPKLVDMCKMYFSIPELFSNEELFSIYDDAYKSKYELYGIVCYSNVQYISFFISQLKNEVDKYWILHNDMEVIKLPLWKDVITYCIMNSYHPVMLYYREMPDKPDLSIRCDLADGDYFQMFNHSLKVDLENAITYANEANVKETLRPSKNLAKFLDDNLLQSLNNMKKDLQPKKMKRRSQDIKDQDDESVTLTDGTKKYSSRGETEETIPSKVIEESKQERYQQIDSQALTSEAFRYNPYQREGDWVCKHENCNNINNKFAFQCLKCKTINMAKFQSMENDKEKQFKEKQEYASTYPLNAGKAMITQQKTSSMRFNSSYQTTSANPKLCINCNSPFKNKCRYCSMSNPLTHSFQTLRDSSTNAINDQSYGIQQKLHMDFLTISKSELSGWICFHCSSYNIMGFEYCKECKKNKQVR